MRHRALVAMLCVNLACAPTLPEGFLSSRAAAERAYSAGRYDEAADLWARAHAAAERPRDRAEALYRQATSLRRAGRWQQAREILKRLAAEHAGTDRGHRAVYDLADIELAHGDAAEGRRKLERFVLEHAAADAAPRALLRYLLLVGDEGGPAAVLSWLETRRGTLAKTRLEETAAYARARALEEAGRPAEALSSYLDLARRFPYPRGAYWDDSLARAAELEIAAGRPARAVDHLELMLKERETAHLQGSYQKVRYAEAQFRIAQLQRDTLNQPRQALDSFRRVFTFHSTSLLRDDALWQEALLARRLGDEARACQAMNLLTDDLPDSRYAACAHLLCMRAKRLEGQSCRDYIAREISPAP